MVSKKTKQAIIHADIVLYVKDITKDNNDLFVKKYLEKKNYITILNKADMLKTKYTNISDELLFCAKKDNIEKILNLIVKKLALDKNDFKNSLQNMHQVNEIKLCHTKIQKITLAIKHDSLLTIDLLAEPIQEIYSKYLLLITPK